MMNSQFSGQPKNAPHFLFVATILFGLSSSVTHGEIYSVCNSQDYTLDIYGDAVLNPFGDCSGNGVCVRNDTACDCEEGWTGLSDIINTEGIDCQINILAVKVMWGLLIAHILWSQAKVFPVFRLRLDAFNQKRESILQEPIFLSCCIFECIVIPSIVIFGLIRISNDNERIGVTFAATFVFAIFGTSFWYGSYLFGPTVVETILKSTSLNPDKFKSQLRMNRWLARIHNSLNFSKWFIPFFVYAENGVLNDSTELLWKLYLMLNVFTLFYSSGFSIYMQFAIRRVFKNNHRTSENKEMKEAESMLLGVAKQGTISCFLYGSINLAFLLIPFLWNKYDYYVPFLMFGSLINANKNILATALRSQTATKQTSVFEVNKDPEATAPDI